MTCGGGVYLRPNIDAPDRSLWGHIVCNCLTHVMEGAHPFRHRRASEGDELREFHRYHERLGDVATFLALPSPDFAGIDDYIDYMRDYIVGPGFDVLINGGTQFRRLMFEVVRKPWYRKT